MAQLYVNVLVWLPLFVSTRWRRVQPLTLFDFNGNSIRTLDLDGTVWFPAKDVCDALGLAKASNAVRHACDEDHHRNVLKSEISNAHTVGISFPNRGMLCVSEAGIYDLINLSKKPAAKAFRKWVNSTVLPAIRKDGGYVLGEEKVATGEMSEEAVMALSLRAMEGLKKKLKADTGLGHVTGLRVKAEA